MWLADNWKDYEVLDTSAGEKLERWGSYILVRPDPQVIWNTPKDDPLWRKYDARYARSSTGGGKWQNLRLPAQWQVRYKELTFQVKPMNFKHTGVFPEQAANWDFMMEQIRSGRPAHPRSEPLRLHGRRDHRLRRRRRERVPRGRGQGHGRSGRRRTRRSPGWRRNRSAGSWTTVRNSLSGRSAAARRTTPSSWTRRATAAVPSGEVWKLEENLYPFVELVSKVLSDDPLFFIINSYTTGLAPSVMRYLTETIVSKRYGGYTQSDELGLPVRDTGLALPCGATCRWTKEKL